MDYQNTKHKGSMAVSKAIETFYELGYEVSLPIGDRKPYDMIVEKDNQLYKVQVKFSGKNTKGQFIVDLRVKGGNQSFYTIKFYDKKDFDLLFVYTEDNRRFLINWENLAIKSVLKIDCKKYRDFEVASLV